MAAGWRGTASLSLPLDPGEPRARVSPLGGVLGSRGDGPVGRRLSPPWSSFSTRWVWDHVAGKHFLRDKKT